MNIELTRVSSKGQVVIPNEVREQVGLREGQVLAVSAKDKVIILKKIDNPIEEDDLRALAEIKDAWKEIAEGKYKKMKSSDFIREISKW